MILCILIYTPLLVSYDCCKLRPLLLAKENVHFSFSLIEDSKGLVGEAWCVNFAERQDRWDLWIYESHEAWFASWSVCDWWNVFLSVLENLNISLKPHTQEEILKVFPFKFVPPKILFKIFTRCVNFSKIWGWNSISTLPPSPFATPLIV